MWTNCPPIFQLETIVNFSDPFLVLEIVFRETKVVFPAPGEYRLQLFARMNRCLNAVYKLARQPNRTLREVLLGDSNP